MTLITQGAWRDNGGGGTWAGGLRGAGMFFTPGKTWVMHGGVWTPPLGGNVAYGQTNVGTITAPVWEQNWYMQFNNRRPDCYVSGLVANVDNHGITETPGDPGSTLTVSWTSYGGGTAQPYEAIRCDFYRNGSFDHSKTTAYDPTTTSSGSLTSNGIYHLAANDSSYPADTYEADVYFVNPYADSTHQTAPTVETVSGTY